MHLERMTRECGGEEHFKRHSLTWVSVCWRTQLGGHEKYKQGRRGSRGLSSRRAAAFSSSTPQKLDSGLGPSHSLSQLVLMSVLGGKY